MNNFVGFERGMGIGGWLTNYKRFQVLSKNMVNILSPGDLEHFETYITKKDVENIASMGFDHIRVCFDQIVLEDVDGNSREEHFKLVTDFISWCKEYNLNVVLNLHKARGNYCDVETGESLFTSEELQESFIAFWEKIEEHCAIYPDVVFELLNETKDIEPDLWNDLAEKTIKRLRILNSTRRIIVGTTFWNHASKLPYLRVYDDENIAYTFHFYLPEEFTHQRGVLRYWEGFYNREIAYPAPLDKYNDYQMMRFGNTDEYAGFDYMDKEVLRQKMICAKQFREKYPDKVLWCGEFGTIRHCKLEWRIAWFRDVISILREWGIPYSVWNYLSAPYDGNRFSLVDDDTREILSDELLKALLGK